MHELFVTTVLPNKNVKEALKILQGLCGMNPVHRFERMIIFEGPKANPLMGIGALQIQGRKQANLSYWRELHEQLIRQSYYISLSYEVNEDHFPKTNPIDGEEVHVQQSIDVEEARGTLNFLDHPDPPGSRPVNSRLVIHIKDEARLPALLRSIRYTYSSEKLRETYNAYRDNVTFSLSRDLQWPKGEEALGGEHGETIISTLPPLEDFLPFDGENKWVLTASVEVSDEKQGVFMQRGIEQLETVKNDLSGVFEFGITPRRLLDTRLLSYLQSVRG